MQCIDSQRILLFFDHEWKQQVENLTATWFQLFLQRFVFFMLWGEPGRARIVVYLKSAYGSTPREHYTRNGLQGPIPSIQLPDLAQNAFSICFWAKSSRLGVPNLENLVAGKTSAWKVMQ